MHWRAITRLFGVLLSLYSLTFLPSIGISLIYADQEALNFVLSFFITAFAGGFLWLVSKDAHGEIRVHEGFLVVALFWALMGAFGALPFILGLHLNFTDAIFESVSGFTTAGATVITGLDTLPYSILYHRSQIQWLGGVGFVVLMVAIMPLLGIGGMQLFKAEVSGVSKEDKLTPRIAETARALWIIYVALTALCAFCFWAAGMSFFDAICHSFTTLATGGFSTHDASFGYWNDSLIETVAIIFMFAGGINFAIHFLAWKSRNIKAYMTDPEVRAYTVIFLISALFIASTLYFAGAYTGTLSSIRYATFQVISTLTTTGYTTAAYAEWPLYIPLVLVILSYVGGCAGSTAGGMKVLRMMLLAKLGARQLYQLSHPRAVSVIKLGDRLVTESVLYSMWGFYVLYIITALILTVLMMATGLDLESAFGAVSATLNVLGPGLGETASTFTTVSPVAKWLGIFAMLVGRLEVFTVLILMMPSYWRR